MAIIAARQGLWAGIAVVSIGSAVQADVADDCANPAIVPAARIAACEVAIEAALDTHEKARLIVERAEAHRSQGDHDAVLADLAEAERLAPDADPALRADMLVQRSEVFRLRDDFDAALADIMEAEQLAPEDADPLVNHGLVLHDQGDYAGAVAELVQAVALEPENDRAVLTAMYVLFAAEDYETCLKYGAKAVDLAPARPQTWFYRGNCLDLLGRNDEAIRDFELAAAIGIPNPSDQAILLDNLSAAHLEAGRAQEALESVRRALELNPMFESAHLSLVSALIATGAIEEAIEAYRDAQADGVEDTLGQANNLAWNLYLEGHYNEALPIMEEWLAAHPRPTGDQYYELDTLAHLLAAAGRTYESAQTFLRAVEVGGPELEAHYVARLTELGFPPEPDEGGLEAALQACTQTGPACLISP